MMMNQHLIDQLVIEITHLAFQQVLQIFERYPTPF